MPHYQSVVKPTLPCANIYWWEWYMKAVNKCNVKVETTVKPK